MLRLGVAAAFLGACAHGFSMMMPSARTSVPARKLSGDELTALKRDSFVVVRSYASHAVAKSLRDDALTLRRLSIPRDAAVMGGNTQNQGRSCQHAWLQNNDGRTAFQPASPRKGFARRWLAIAPWAWGRVLFARNRGRLSRCYLDSLVATLELQLSVVSAFGGEEREFDRANITARESELAYLYYSPGGFYAQHFDTPGHRVLDEEDPAAHRRAFSFVLYLNRDWAPVDGGQLRISRQISPEEQRRRSSPSADCRGSWVDDDGTTSVNPESGTLVLFRSEAIPHEVVETHRAREAVVGWLHGSISAGGGAFEA